VFTWKLILKNTILGGQIMDKNLYSIYDKKSGTYMQPFVDLTDGTATRQCMDLLNNTNAPFAKFPEDFT
jgi:hypothetical protein